MLLQIWGKSSSMRYWKDNSRDAVNWSAPAPPPENEMKKIVFAMTLALTTCGALAQSNPAPAPDWKVLNDTAIALFQKGDVDGAAVTGAKALEAATAALGPDHLRVASMQNNLAALYRCRRSMPRPSPCTCARSPPAEGAGARRSWRYDHNLRRCTAQDHSSRPRSSTCARSPFAKANGPDHLETAAAANAQAALPCAAQVRQGRAALACVCRAREGPQARRCGLTKTKKDLWTLYASRRQRARRAARRGGRHHDEDQSKLTI